MSTGEATTTVNVEEYSSAADAAGRAPAAPSAPAAPAAPPATAARKARMLPMMFFRKTKAGGGGWKRGIAVFGFLLRILAIGATLAATITMGTTYETLPFFTKLFQFHAYYADFPPLTFFVVGNAIAAGYLALSLPFSIVTICLPQLQGPWLLLLVFDTVMVALTTAAAASATSIVYLAHTGNARANWVEICFQFHGFCRRITGAVVASFVAVVLFMLLVVMSALAMRRSVRDV